MRIFFAAARTANQFLPNSNIWHLNLYLPLLDLGHEVVLVDFDYTEYSRNLDPTETRQREFISTHRPIHDAELYRQVKMAHCKKPLDVFFSYFYSAHVTPDVIRAIGDLGITTVNWYCNASYQLHLVKDIAPAYDYCLVPEKFRLDDYRRLGATPIYCQEAANPDIYKPYDLPLEFDVTFVGQRYGNRPSHIRALLNAGIDARVWGPCWREGRPLWRQMAGRVRRIVCGQKRYPSADDVPLSRCGLPLSDDELIRMYSRSRISLGFTSVAELPVDNSPAIKQVRLRDFEATMSGAFYLVEYFEELGEFFEYDKEIVGFNSSEELVDKARYYLSNEGEAERIRQAGMKRARSEHTWHRRFETVFKKMGLT